MLNWSLSRLGWAHEKQFALCHNYGASEGADRCHLWLLSLGPQAACCFFPCFSYTSFDSQKVQLLFFVSCNHSCCCFAKWLGSPYLGALWHEMHEQYLVQSNCSSSRSCLQTYATESLVQAWQGLIEWKDFWKYYLAFTLRPCWYYGLFCANRIADGEAVGCWWNRRISWGICLKLHPLYSAMTNRYPW